MYGLAALCVVLGLLCGTVLRLLVFGVILVAATVILLAVGLTGVAEVSPFAALVALVMLQIGYGLGVIVRAVIRAYRSRK